MKKYMKQGSCLIVLVYLIVIGQSCERLGTVEENPFETNENSQDTVNFQFENIDPNSIAGLYKNIFQPTCANAGCHDGNFEPDFRTIESSYHSLVYKIPIKNDGTLTYRVDPGNPDGSAILKRVMGTIEPIMPIEVEPDGDWDKNGDEYIANIRTWIEGGALDLAGNESQPDVLNPSLFGALAVYQGEVLSRENGYGFILIPNSIDEIELYLAFDTINNPEDFKVNELAIGFEEDGVFEENTSFIMTILDMPLIEYGMTGTLVNYTHKLNLNLNTLSVLDKTYFLRAKVQDGTNPIIEIPANNGIYYIKEYMSFRRTD